MAIRIGIIGLSANPRAWVSSSHMQPLQSDPELASRFKVTALATSSPTTALASAEKWGISKEKAYSTAEEIASDPDIDLVVVGVKLPLHRDMALPALRAGKDVFVEWPLAHGEDVVKELLEAAQEGGGRTVIGLQARCSPPILKAKEILDSGMLGRIISTNIYGVDNMLLYLPPAYDYEHLDSNGAGVTTIASGHTLDAMCFLLGEFDHLTAQSTCNFPNISTPHHEGILQRDAPDSLSVQGVLENGAIATFHIFSTTQQGPSYLSWTITGEQGSLRFEGSNVNIQMAPPVLSQYLNDEQKWEVVETGPPLARGQVHGIYQAYAFGEKAKGSLVDFEGAALRHRMLDACVRSSKEGTVQTYLK